MNQVYSEARDRIGQVLHDHMVEHIDQESRADRPAPGIDWYDAREYDQMAEKVLAAIWAGGSEGMPKVHAQFSTGGETGLRGTQEVDVLKVEPNDDGTLTVTLNYWPEPKTIRPTFEKAWADCEAQGFRYGPGALEQVKLGWELATAYEAVSAPSTPANYWSGKGEPDPHDNLYDCERAALAMGHLTDDGLANGAFLNYDQPLNIAGILAKTHSSPIAWMTAVKDRIRWLSRSLTKAKNREQELAASLKRMCDMHDAMFKQTNVGASFFGGDTIREMNEAPLEARRLLVKK